jgi:putative hemolysin
MQRNSESFYKNAFTYSQTSQPLAKRLLISGIENFTARLSLIDRMRRYEDEGKMTTEPNIWKSITECYGISLELVNSTLSNIPKTGPLILVANHPYGILDSVVMGYILSCTRPEFRIVAHQIFMTSPQLRPFLLPIDFASTKQALIANAKTRMDAVSSLLGGTAIGIFPGGTVSTSARLFSRPMDPQWRTFTARLIQKSGATVVPIYFDGENSRLFQLASHAHSLLRVSLLLREFEKRLDKPVRVVIGKPIANSEIGANAGNTHQLMDLLRLRTYELAPKPLDSFEYGYDFG